MPTLLPRSVLHAPPGEYLIQVGMYRPVDGVRLSVSGVDGDGKNRRVLLRGLLNRP
ncbi:MAG: hypothetical protein JW934_07390 [Anaerolineae bacterium]|nr:hypothetical protein [Anaerolineae bacterium]